MGVSSSIPFQSWVSQDPMHCHLNSNNQVQVCGAGPVELLQPLSPNPLSHQQLCLIVYEQNVLIFNRGGQVLMRV